MEALRVLRKGIHMKDEKFLKNWKKARRDGKTVYMIKFSLATLIGILIGDLFLFVFYGLNKNNLMFSFVLFASMSIPNYYKWDKNEERYKKLVNNNQEPKTNLH